MSVYLCCLDVTYCLRCFVYWDQVQPQPPQLASEVASSDRYGGHGSLWEKTMWRYWRCWSEGDEDIEDVIDNNKHFHRYCECDSDFDNVMDVDDEIEDLELTESDDLSFESTFERDMLLNFTDFSCHQVVSENHLKQLT